MTQEQIEELRKFATASKNRPDLQVEHVVFRAAANPAVIIALIQQRDELLAALEQERKRLDWALKHDSFYDHTTGVFFCDPAFKILNPQVRVETDDPRATIDRLMVQS